MDKIKTYKILQKLAKIDVEDQQKRLKSLIDEQSTIEEKIENLQCLLDKERSFFLENSELSQDFYAFEQLTLNSIKKLKNRLLSLEEAIEGEKEVLLEFFSKEKKTQHIYEKEQERQKNLLNYKDEILAQDLMLMRRSNKNSNF